MTAAYATEAGTNPTILDVLATYSVVAGSPAAAKERFERELEATASGQSAKRYKYDRKLAKELEWELACKKKEISRLEKDVARLASSNRKRRREEDDDEDEGEGEDDDDEEEALFGAPAAKRAR